MKVSGSSVVNLTREFGFFITARSARLPSPATVFHCAEGWTHLTIDDAVESKSEVKVRL
jgi:hypothetical protein